MGGRRIRVAGVDDAGVIGRLLAAFNTEFDDPTPPPDELAERFRALLVDDTAVLLADEDDETVAIAVLRFRSAIWSAGKEAYLAELYVVPERRGGGIGRALMEEVLAFARRRGADWMEIGVDEPDTAARRLYESLGFSNHVDGNEGPVMFVYERDL